MDGGRYGGARAAAPRVAEHFAKHIADARRDINRTVAFAPDAPTLETIIDAAFWASLRREEGFVPLAFHTKRLAFECGLKQACTDIIRFSHGASSSHKVYRSSFIPSLHDTCMIFENSEGPS